jgi:hypothetical protein
MLITGPVFPPHWNVYAARRDLIPANPQYAHPNAIRVSTNGDELGRPAEVAYP